MTSDDFLAGLRDDWRQAPVDLGPIRQRTIRRRLWQGLVNLVSLAAMIGGILLGLWFAWRAFTDGDPLDAVGAIALFVAVPVLVLEFLEGRRARRVRYDDTPQGVLLQARRQLEFSRRLQFGCRASALILGAAALAAFLLGLIGAVADRRAFTTALTWGITAAGIWLWDVWRRRRIDRESASCERMMAEIGADDPA